MIIRRSLRKSFFLIISCIIISANIMAQESKWMQFKNSLRPFLERTIGQEWSDKLLGPLPKTIQIPAIPPLPENKATSVDVYDRTEEDNSNFSQEEIKKYNLSYIKELYKRTLLRNVQDDELTKWMNVLSQGGSREGVYRGVVYNVNYENLERSGIELDEASVNFTQHFFQKYINQDADRSIIKKFNPYSIKKICTEKALEIMDAFGNQRDPLNRWYAVLSSELAKKFGKIWELDIRKNENSLVHYKWAQSVQKSSLKSEIILKLHAVFNYLTKLNS